MRKVVYILLLGLLMSKGRAALIVGLHSEEDHYNIISINTQTGASSTLVDNAFTDFYGGSFISNSTLGVGYAITDNSTLYQFNLLTGQLLANPAVGGGGALALGASGNLVGLRFDTDHFDLFSINPSTGASSMLTDNAFADFYGGSFISNTTLGVGYAITDSSTLYQFDLATGQVLANPAVGGGGALALGASGNLVGLRFDTDHYNIVSINPQTGISSTLIDNAFPDFYSGTFKSNPSLGIGYVLTDEQKLLQFDLSTGQVVSQPALDEIYRSLAFAAVPEPSTYGLILSGVMFALGLFRSRANQRRALI